MAKVFEELGITEAMAAKAKYGAGGAGGLAGLVVLRGEADIGIQQMAELMAVAGIDVVGPLPADIAERHACSPPRSRQTPLIRKRRALRSRSSPRRPPKA